MKHPSIYKTGTILAIEIPNSNWQDEIYEYPEFQSGDVIVAYIEQGGEKYAVGAMKWRMDIGAVLFPAYMNESAPSAPELQR